LHTPAGTEFAMREPGSGAGHSLSIVVPLRDEEDNVLPLVTQVQAALAGAPWPWQLILVDDGSRDRTSERIREAVAACPRHLSGAILRRGFGQTAAMQAGIDLARGTVIATLDGDLQNNPHDIVRMVRRLLDEDLDLLVGWRRARRDGLWRRLPSRLGNRLIGLLTGVPLHDYGCTLKVYRVAALEGIRLYGEMHRLIPAFAAHEGARVGELAVDHHPRRAGRSSYGIDRTLKVILDLIVMKFLFGYATKPIYVFGAIGVASCLAGVLAGGVTVIEKLLAGVYVHRNPLILLAVFLFLLGVQCVLMGLLAELLIRTYHESQRKATYVVAERVHPADGDSV